jgi:poly(3-hydroxybutyrate) depolymerase
MLYIAYQTQSDLMEPIRALARSALSGYRFWSSLPWSLLGESSGPRSLAALCELTLRAKLCHERPGYGIERVSLGSREIAVFEEKIDSTPFGTLLRFRKGVEIAQPRILVVAPLSGHFATLLRNTVETLLPEHDVYITDWHNARDVPLAAGRFGLDEYVDHLIRFLETLGSGAHVLAVCQPCVQVLSAVALMAEGKHPATPRSMSLMAGPVDTRINPTKVNTLATARSLEWFERHVIAEVPAHHAGAGRSVYPGFLQLLAFMSMNVGRHVKAHRDLYRHLARGEVAEAAPIKNFYDEYFCVLDLTAEFYLETVRDVFQNAALAKGDLAYRGRAIDLKQIRETALLTVEGERDDICSVGQTAAAHELCSGLKPYQKRHHLQAGVGHYGVFSGKCWATQIYPIFRNFVLASD